MESEIIIWLYTRAGKIELGVWLILFAPAYIICELFILGLSIEKFLDL